ncbi:DUF1758 domain-containing protein [Trichonephila clavipes]|uniref:DUF1758 domain-containing protein n=1 Tax=Trichonephila clavipes TaxID=2585209 RepID=A0A8X6RJ99_TRICX|nr:DUF1758 domain-containing protein [Trichonephila clavipes]
MCSEKEMKTKSIQKSESSLSNSSKSKTVFLQTLCVIIRCQGQEKLIRAVIDSGSQRNSVELESGLTAVETKLGWTVFGKGSCVKDNIVTTLSMHSMNIPVNKLWELEVLGISSPTEIEKQKTELSLNDFNNRIKILPDGRYEVELPWKYDSLKLPKNCQPQHEEVAQKLKSSFYVDNCVSGVFNTDEQGRFIEHAKLIMLNGCFNLRGFESNVAGKNVDRSSCDTSVLGVIWNLETDTLKCCTDMDTLTCETKITKRLILAIVQKIFDPIGLLTPATLLPKLLIQHLWKMKNCLGQ